MDYRTGSHYDAFGEALGWISVVGVLTWAAAALLLATRSGPPLWRWWLVSLLLVGGAGGIAGAVFPHFYPPAGTWARFVLLVYAPASASTTLVLVLLERFEPLRVRALVAFAVGAAVLLSVGHLTGILVFPFSAYGAARAW
jgi:cytochrome bd-type quinol oxidase subunit 2